MDVDDPDLSRDALISAVLDGELSKEDAVRIAAERDFEPLEERPADDRFDVSAEPMWTLEMSVTWIMWRDLGRVRQMWDSFRNECWHFLFQDNVGYTYERWKPATLSRLRIGMQLEQHAPAVSPREAVTDIWRRILSGTITAYGAVKDGVVLDPIPVAHVAQAVPDQDVPGQLILKSDGTPLYRRASFLRDAVLSLWPPAHHESGELDDERELPAPRDADADLTGAPGRPSKSMSFIRAEFERRRRDEVALEPSLAAEARTLLEWLVKAHPTKPRPTEGTIENAMRADYRNAKGSVS